MPILLISLVYLIYVSWDCTICNVVNNFRLYILTMFVYLVLLLGDWIVVLLLLNLGVRDCVDMCGILHCNNIE